MKRLLIMAVTGLLCSGCPEKALAGQSPEAVAQLETAAGEAKPGAPYTLRGFAGNYLSSHFAQSQNDWTQAKNYLEHVLAKDPYNEELVKRSMILAMGAGDIITASKRAKVLIEQGNAESLAYLIRAVDKLSQNDLEGALPELDAMPAGDMTDFLRPILKGWIDAGGGHFNIGSDFGDTSIHMYHGALMAFFAGDKDTARAFADRLMKVDGLSVYEGERIADLLAALGETDAAIGFYKGLQVQGGDNKTLRQKLEAAQGKKIDSVKPMLAPLQIRNSAGGAALTMLDMARILYQEHSDSSAKLFVQMALTLDYGQQEARLLLANIMAREGRYEDALKYFQAIPSSSELYKESQYLAADMLSEIGRLPEAQAVLNKLYEAQNDIDALIRVGDLYREQEDYDNALMIYNKAATALGGDPGEKYWFLLYARGMAYERQGQWDKAEADLLKALEFQPDNPYLLNYLGYGWADQGMNLDKSLAMIERAVKLRPNDGYITDSLGWVHYMMGNYDKALPYIEKAVELLPYDSTVNDHLGDVYWQAGRRFEARYQWERALDRAEDEKMAAAIRDKLKFGLRDVKTVREASSSVPE